MGGGLLCGEWRVERGRKAPLHRRGRAVGERRKAPLL